MTLVYKLNDETNKPRGERGLLLEPKVGIEPTTCRLRIGCSTAELLRRAKGQLANVTSQTRACQVETRPRVRIGQGAYLKNAIL